MNFSVLIPIYTKESPEFFNQALESIVQQTLLPSEIVIVEDGPISNELRMVLNNFESRYPNLFNIVKLEHNSGMGVAMNTGLHYCKYNYVARMDSDDIAKPNRFEIQFNFLKQNPNIDVLGCNIEEFKFKVHDLNRVRRLPELHDDLKEFIKKRSPFNHMTVVFKKQKAIEAGGYWSQRNLEDYNLWYEMLKRGAIFHNLQEILVDVRIGNNMAKRRHGYAYFLSEYDFFHKMMADHFITKIRFYRNVVLRLFLRVMPLPFLQVAYSFFLRNSR